MRTIVTGLRSILRFNNDARISVNGDSLLRLIRDDVNHMTMAMANLSIYLHYVFSAIIAEFGINSETVATYFTNITSNTIRNYLSEVIGTSAPVAESRHPGYEAIRASIANEHQPPYRYDCHLRTGIQQQASDLFTTNFKNHIQRNMGRWLLRYYMKIGINGITMSKREAYRHVQDLLGINFAYDDHLGIRFDALEENIFIFRLSSFTIETHTRKSSKVNGSCKRHKCFVVDIGWYVAPASSLLKA
jgi:hypothetical protein